MALSPDAYRRQLQGLLPQGAAWPREPDAALTELLDALADGLARVDGRADRLIAEADPRTTLEMLPDWERVAGLPDGCLPAGTGLEARRAALLARLVERGGQGRAYYQRLAELLNISIEIEEWRPLIAGISRCGTGHMCGPAALRFVWRVRVTGPRVRWFRTGSSRGGDQLARIERARELECLLARLKPAHTTVIVSYDDGQED